MPRSSACKRAPMPDVTPEKSNQRDWDAVRRYPALPRSRATLWAIRRRTVALARWKWVASARCVTFDEDRCQVRSGAALRALAACRNLVLVLLRRRPDGCANVAAALRTYAARPHHAVALLTSPSTW